MADDTWIVGDTSPPVTATLTNDDGTVKDLTAATGLRFQMRLAMDRRFLVDAEADVVTAAAGTVKYEWADEDTDTPGEYVSRWRIVWNDGSIEHTEPENTISIEAA